MVALALTLPGAWQSSSMSVQPYLETDVRFLQNRRTPLLGYPVYEDKVSFALEVFAVHEEPVDDRIAHPDNVSGLAALFGSSQGAASSAVEYGHLQYSAGADVGHLAGWLSRTLDYWETYASYHEAYHAHESINRLVSHLTLGDYGYWDAVRMTSWAILFGRSSQLPRLCRLWDYAHQPLDGLLERMVAPFVSGRGVPPDECTRHLPYFKLLKVFPADPEVRPALMAQYMDDWYEASRREPYYRSHTKGREHNFLGYWSFEAAAVSVLLDINDSGYRDHEFYPKDMADFGRAHKLAQEGDAGESTHDLRLRVEAGQPCPRDGEWETPAQSNSRRRFKQGEVMPSVEGDYGQTIWQWLEN